MNPLLPDCGHQHAKLTVQPDSVTFACLECLTAKVTCLDDVPDQALYALLDAVQGIDYQYMN